MAADTSTAPNIRFDNPFTHADSLSHQMGGVNTIVQDHLGFIWLGAENGLARYDGRELRLYQAGEERPGLPASYVREAVVDADDVLWLATVGGLTRYNHDADDFTRITTLGDTTLTAESVFTLAVDDANRLYAGTPDGLYVIAPDRQSMRLYLPNEAGSPGTMEDEQIRSLAVGPDGKVWAGTASRGVAVFDPVAEEFEYALRHQPDDPNSLVYNDVTAILHDQRGRVWFGTYGGGISRLNPRTGELDNFEKSLNEPGAIKSNVVWDLTQDSQGTIWAALDKGGLARFNEESQSFHHYLHTAYDAQSLVSNTLRVVYEDRNNDLWLGAFPSGVSFYNRSTQIFQHYKSRPNDPESLSHDSILNLEEGSDGTIWVGTEWGLNALDPHTGKFQRFLSDLEDPRALRADAVLVIEEDIDGQLWVGTWGGGLHRLNPQTGDFSRYLPQDDNPNSINSDFIWDIQKDHEDTIWIATETGGLNRYRRETDDFVHYVHDPQDENSLSADFLPALTQDRQGNLWIGTFNGLNRFTPESGEFRRFPANTGTAEATNTQTFRALFEDSQGRIWAGSQHRGVNIYDPSTGQFEYMDVRDGLPSSTVASILEDDHGSIWLATTNGLARVEQPNGQISQYGREDGLAGSNYNRDASLKDQNGNLYFGSTEGISVFHPDDLDKFSTDFPVHITEFRLLNERVPIGAEGSPLERSILLTDAITLSHEDTMFSFDFSALNYRQSSATHYSYRLEGFDRAWNNIGRGASATYTNIDPGRYRFRIRASANGEDWVEGQSLAITVVPPPWRRWWAYLCYAAILGLFLMFAHKYVTLRIRAEAYRSDSLTDPLTHLYNRAGLAQVCEGVFANPTTKQGTCLMLMDIDHFKQVNDERGHDAGDRILCDVTRVVRDCLRTSDYFGRWGGEEFVLMCPTHASANSHLLAEKVRRSVEKHVYEQHTPASLRITVSIGMTDINSEDSFESALKRADEALYKAKSMGRNRVVVAD